MTQRLAAFIMAGRGQAVATGVFLSLLAMVFPPMALLAGAVVGLVTLRLGAGPGLGVAAFGTGALAVFSLLALGDPVSGAIYGLVQWLPVVLLALVLRHTVSWRPTLQAAVVMGLVTVLGLYAWTGDPSTLWREALDPVVRPVLEQGRMTPAELDQVLAQTAGVMTGVFGASLVLSLSLTLVIARAWQAALYNPGGFRPEFVQLRLGRWPGMLVMGLLVLAVWSGGGMALELALVILAAYFLHGIALVHGLNLLLGLHGGWLIGFYALLLFLLPQMMALICAMGVIDGFADIRARVAQRPQ